jgi:hypothetical protein
MVAGMGGKRVGRVRLIIVRVIWADGKTRKASSGDNAAHEENRRLLAFWLE